MFLSSIVPLVLLLFYLPEHFDASLWHGILSPRQLFCVMCIVIYDPNKQADLLLHRPMSGGFNSTMQVLKEGIQFFVYYRR